MAVQVDHRAPAAGDREQIAVDPRLEPGLHPFGTEAHHGHPRDAHVPACCGDHARFQQRDPRTTRGIDARAGGRGTRVDDRCHAHAGRMQVECCAVSAVVVREQHGTPAAAHGVAVQVTAHRRGEHHAGSVVVREDQRPFDRAGRKHDAACAHAPQALPRCCAAARGQVVGA
ncbi:MAG: hypothetical protein ACKPE6_10235, partial [Gammaproteobacteria bacterium]